MASRSPGAAGRTTRNSPSTVASRASAEIQRTGTGSTSPPTSSGVPSTTRTQEVAGAAVVRRWASRPVGERAGAITWNPAASVCAVSTGPEPSAGTETTVLAWSAGGMPVRAARTKKIRRPSGDQAGSKSSQAPSWSGPAWPGNPVTRVFSPERVSWIQIR